MGAQLRLPGAGGRSAWERLRIQPEGELDESKSKKMKGNENNFSFICFQQFFGIGAFQ
jgi:hypothetical protein